jgi:hypothetical protein
MLLHAELAKHEAARQQLQVSLCTAMLKSLQPPTQQQHHQQQPLTTAAAPVLRRHACSATLTATEAAATPAVNISTTTLADAWLAAGPALQEMYGWEDEAVVLAIIAFWASVCDILQGSWLSSQQQQQHSSRAGHASDISLQETDHSHSSNPSTNTTADTLHNPQNHYQQQQQDDAQLGYINWLWHLGHPTLSAVVALLHCFHCLTGICQLQSKQRSPKLHLLLVFLQLGADTAASSSSSSNSSSGSQMHPAQQLLQAARWASVAQQQPYHYQPGNALATCTAEAMKPGEAFAAVVRLLQAAAALQETPPPAAAAAAAASSAPADNNGNRSSSSSSSSSNSKQLDWQQLAAAAGRFLQAAYGWMHLDGRPAAAAAAVYYGGEYSAGAAAAVRPCETPYDCCMMELLHGLLQGPFGRLESAADDAAAAGDGPAAAREVSAAACNRRQQQQQQQQQWEEWCSNDACGALALLVAGYDKPQHLVRGLVALVMHEQQQQQGSVKASSEAEKAAVKKVRKGHCHGGASFCSCRLQLVATVGDAAHAVKQLVDLVRNVVPAALPL